MNRGDRLWVVTNGDRQLEYNVLSPNGSANTSNSSSNGRDNGEDNKISQSNERDLPDGPSLVNTSLNSTSPLSVIELFETKQHRTAKKPDVEISKLQGATTRPRRDRGVDSPKRAVDTKNVYVSVFSNSTKATTTTTGSKVPLSRTSLESDYKTLKNAASAFVTKSLASSALPPLTEPSARPGMPKNPATAGHRRQNTSDSTNSKVAAVARGASKAALETADIHTRDVNCPLALQASTTTGLVIDRPVSCPRRQHTAGSDAFPDPSSEEEDDEEQSLTLDQLCTHKDKSRAKSNRPRPPRHDTVRAQGRASIQGMKRSVSHNIKPHSMEPKHGRPQEPNQLVVMDRPAPRPERQPTAEKSMIVGVPGAATREISLTPKALLERFSKECTDDTCQHDTRDDDGSALDDDDDDGAYFFPMEASTGKPTSMAPTPHSTMHADAIQTWKHMSPQPPHTSEKWSKSGPITRVPRNWSSHSQNSYAVKTLFHNSTAAVMLLDDCQCTFGDDDDDGHHDFAPQMTVQQARAKSLIVSNPSDEDDTTANDASCDDRMFQAWLKMPPRVSTTQVHPAAEDTSVPLYYTTAAPSTDEAGVAERWLATAVAPTPPGQQQQVLTVSTTPSSIRYQCAAQKFCIGGFGGDDGMPCFNDPVMCLDVSAIEEVSIDHLSLPSFFSDCRGHTERDQIHRQRSSAVAIVKTASHDTVLSLKKASVAELQHRMSLPPPMPHRRKPSLHLDDDDDNLQIMEEDKAIHALWSSMPLLSNVSFADTSSFPSSPELQRDLRSSWPSIQMRTDVMEQDSSHHQPPTLPTRFRSQDSVSTCEAECETKVTRSVPSQRHPTGPERMSPAQRASMPPIQPHRRKPSLHLEDLSATSLEKSNDDYTARNPTAAMWASMPVLSKSASAQKRSSLVLPPIMPHRRKPSLNILESGDEGMIEMWLSHHNRNPFDSHGDGDSRGVIANETTPMSPGCGASVPSKAHKRNDSFASESVCSIVLKEGEAEI
jgi:hypothetical protein